MAFSYFEVFLSRYPSSHCRRSRLSLVWTDVRLSLSATRTAQPGIVFRDRSIAPRRKQAWDGSGFTTCATFGQATRVMQGVDNRTVQELLGHQSITTTMRYAHYAPQHATQSIREVQKREAERFALAQEKNRRRDSEGEKKTQSAALTR